MNLINQKAYVRESPIFFQTVLEMEEPLNPPIDKTFLRECPSSQELYHVKRFGTEFCVSKGYLFNLPFLDTTSSVHCEYNNRIIRIFSRKGVELGKKRTLDLRDRLYLELKNFNYVEHVSHGTQQKWRVLHRERRVEIEWVDRSNSEKFKQYLECHLDDLLARFQERVFNEVIWLLSNLDKVAGAKLCILKIDGLVASSAIFLENGELKSAYLLSLSFKQDERWLKLSPGLLILIKGIETLSANNYLVLDLGSTGQRYKVSLSSHVYRTKELCTRKPNFRRFVLFVVLNYLSNLRRTFRILK